MKFGDFFHKYELHSFVTMVTYWVSSLSDIGFSGHLWLSNLIFAMVPQLHDPASNEYVRSKLWPQVRGDWKRVSCMGKCRLYLALINQAGSLYGRILTNVVSTDQTQ